MSYWYGVYDADYEEPIAGFDTREEAEAHIARLECEDKALGSFVPSHYRVVFNDDFYDLSVEYMDDEIREELHNKLAPCSNEEFLEAYKDAHFNKYGEEFVIN